MRKISFCFGSWKVKNKEVRQSKVQENFFGGKTVKKETFLIETALLTNANFSEALIQKILVKKLSEDQKINKDLHLWPLYFIR